VLVPPMKGIKIGLGALLVWFGGEVYALKNTGLPLVNAAPNLRAMVLTKG